MTDPSTRSARAAMLEFHCTLAPMREVGEIDAHDARLGTSGTVVGSCSACVFVESEDKLHRIARTASDRVPWAGEPWPLTELWEVPQDHPLSQKDRRISRDHAHSVVKRFRTPTTFGQLESGTFAAPSSHAMHLVLVNLIESVDPAVEGMTAVLCVSQVAVKRWLQ